MISSRETFTLCDLDFLKELIHDLAEELWIYLALWSIRVNTLLQQLIRLKLTVHHYKDLISQLVLWRGLVSLPLLWPIHILSTVRVDTVTPEDIDWTECLFIIHTLVIRSLSGRALLFFHIIIAFFKVEVHELLKVLIGSVQIWELLKHCINNTGVKVLENALQELGLLLEIALVYFFASRGWHTWCHVSLILANLSLRVASIGMHGRLLFLQNDAVIVHVEMHRFIQSIKAISLEISLINLLENIINSSSFLLLLFLWSPNSLTHIS